jgi:hypothetical protein
MTTRSPETAAWLYLTNTVLLTVHEIDSAYWHEWQLLRLPGGIDLFLILHIPILGVVLYGFWRVVQQRAGARAFSGALAVVGIGTFSLHMILMAAGNPEFREPVSLTVLGAVLVVSGIQLGTVLRASVP